MSANEKDFLEIFESLSVTIASVAITAEIIAKAIKEISMKPDEKDGGDSEQENR